MGEDQLEFMFSLFDSLSGPAGKMGGSLDQLGNKLNAAGGTSQHVEKTLDHMAGTLEKLVDKMGETADAAKGIEQIAVGEVLVRGFEMAWDAGKKVLETLYDIGKEIIQAAALAEKQRLSFRLLLGTEGAEDVEKYIDGIAKHTAFVRSELNTLAMQALRGGFGKDDLPKILAAAQDMAAFAGGGVSNAQEAIAALARIRLRGHVDARSLMPFGISEKDILDPLAKEMQISVKELKKKMEEGKVNPDMLLNTVLVALQNREGGVLGTGAVRAGSTLDASLHKIGGAMDQFFEGISKTQGFAKLADFLDRIAKMLDPDSAWGQQMMAAISETFDAIFGNLDPKEAMQFIAEGLQTVLGWVKQFPEFVHQLGDAWDAIKPALKEAWEVLKAIGRALEWIAKNSIGPFIDQLNRINEQKTTVEDIAKKYNVKIDWEKGTAIGGLVKGIEDGKNDVADAIQSTAEYGGQKGLDAHSPSRLFGEFGRQSAAGFAAGFAASSDTIADAVRGSATADVSAAQMRRSGGGGSISISVPITIHVDGGGHGDSETLAQTIAKRVAEIVPATIATAMEQLAAEQGVDQGG